MAKQEKTNNIFALVKRTTQYGGTQLTVRVEVLVQGEESLARIACFAVVRGGVLYSTRKVRWEEPKREKMPYGFTPASKEVLEVMKEWCSTGRVPETLWALPS